ncbi:MAG: hypothetical protein ACRDQZ_13215 [Mycobacteriales bacterium]
MEYKVRGFIRAESRVKATISPTGYKSIESVVDKEANDVMTLTGSALAGDVVVVVVVDRHGGVAVQVHQRGKSVMTASVPDPESDRLAEATLGAMMIRSSLK